MKVQSGSSIGLNTRRRQGGAFLLLIALVILVATSAFLLRILHSNNKLVMTSQAGNSALYEARDALLGYALAYAHRHPTIGDAIPGYLPCPDLDGDGLADGGAACGSSADSRIGRLPWRSLGLNPPTEGQRECLWYAVSGAFKSPEGGAGTARLTSDIDGLFQIEDERGNILSGSTSRNRAIAVLFLAGEAITTGNYSQQRDVAGNRTPCGASQTNAAINQARNYLDQHNGIDNARGTKTGASAGQPGRSALPTLQASVFVTASEQDSDSGVTFNDSMLWITRDTFAPVFEQMNTWILTKVRNCVYRYGEINVIGTRRYPWAAPLDASASPSYNEQTGQRFGRIPATLLPGRSWPDEPGSSPPVPCFSWPWWDNWREQVFYAVHQQHTDPIAAPVTDLRVDGNSQEFVVLLANERLTASQDRSSYNAQGRIQNYLEGDNQPQLDSARIPPGQENFVSPAAAAATPFNDLLCHRSGCEFN